MSYIGCVWIFSGIAQCIADLTLRGYLYSVFHTVMALIAFLDCFAVLCNKNLNFRSRRLVLVWHDELLSECGSVQPSP